MGGCPQLVQVLCEPDIKNLEPKEILLDWYYIWMKLKQFVKIPKKEDQ